MFVRVCIVIESDGIATPVGQSAELMAAGATLPLHYAAELWTPPHSDYARGIEAGV